VREAALLHVLRHPGIVSYREAFVTRSGFICLIMQYATGGDLHDFLQAQRMRVNEMLQEMQILRWLVQLLTALWFLHERHVRHRDIKARNIFLRGEGKVIQLGDFGISTVLDSADGFVSSAIERCFGAVLQLLRCHSGQGRQQLRAGHARFPQVPRSGA